MVAYVVCCVDKSRMILESYFDRYDEADMRAALLNLRNKPGEEGWTVRSVPKRHIENEYDYSCYLIFVYNHDGQFWNMENGITRDSRYGPKEKSLEIEDYRSDNPYSSQDTIKIIIYRNIEEDTSFNTNEDISREIFNKYIELYPKERANLVQVEKFIKRMCKEYNL